MTSVHFCADFDHAVLAVKRGPLSPVRYFGEKKLLDWLERQLGLGGYPSNTDYLRIELYRQSLGQHDQERATFYGQSFQNDRFATAEALLAWRDELLLAGWQFEVGPESPPRLQDLAAVESIFRKKIKEGDHQRLAFGFADRFEQVLTTLQTQAVQIRDITLYAPEELQKPSIQRFLAWAKSSGIPYAPNSQFVATEAIGGDLGILKNALGGIPQPKPNDAGKTGQIMILRSRRDSDAAIFLAQVLRNNPDWNPVFLIPTLDFLLEDAFQHEGLPALGISSSSLARPSLQILKLAPTFLWEPVDVYKLMEFLTLSVKPIDSTLALEMARVLADKPGLYNSNWFATVYGHIEKSEMSDELREQYEFWFARRRYPIDKTAPKRDAIALYGYLEEWGRIFYEETGSNNPSLLVLADQARRIREMLEALPEQRISFLELERIVRTIYQASPVQLSNAEVSCFEYVHRPSCLLRPMDSLVWWNCNFDGQMTQADKWQASERLYLAEQHVLPYTPAQERQWQQWMIQRPILVAKELLILVVPDQVGGAEALPSLLLGDIEAALGAARFKEIQYDIGRATDRQRLATVLAQAEGANIRSRVQQRIKPQLLLPPDILLGNSPYETPTNLENLFYYPHRWFFKQKLRFYAGGLLQITRENTLKGNLAHRFFEDLLKEPVHKSLSKSALHEWIDEKAAELLPREGAPLLLYGHEPERQGFLNKVKNATWAFLSILRNNGWEVLHTEHELEGDFAGMTIRGKADLVLARDADRAVVDLKWSGVTRRKEMIQNGEDLQLVLYSKLLPPPEAWPHSAYFILEDAKMIARSNAAFKEAVVAGKFEDHAAACEAIFARMEQTFAWRMGQVKEGKIELRNARTAFELEQLYEGQLWEILEMKQGDAAWDEFRVLLDH
jgi:ATP-dependent helicase/nuclease subunit B